MKFYYRDLWISQTATDMDIKRAFRQLALEHHPDHQRSADSSTFRAIREAYKTLSNAELRRNYDESLNRYLKQQGWVLCLRCGAHHPVTKLPASKVATCGRCQTPLPILEIEPQSEPISEFHAQVLSVAARLGTELVLVAAEHLNRKLQEIHTRSQRSAQKGRR